MVPLNLLENKLIFSRFVQLRMERGMGPVKERSYGIRSSDHRIMGSWLVEDEQRENDDTGIERKENEEERWWHWRCNGGGALGGR